MFATLGYYICIPFAWLLRTFYTMTGSYGLAIILFTLVIKLIMLPFQMKSKKSMIRMSRMNDQLMDLRKKYANNQAKLNEEMTKMYAEAGVNPMSGCLWSFLPLPILIALYSILRQPITHFMMISEDVLYSLIDKVSAAGVNMASILQMKDGVAVMKDGIAQLSPYGQISLVKLINADMPNLVENLDGWINVNYQFLGLDLTVNPWDAVKAFQFNWATIGLILIPLLAGGFQVIQMKATMKDQPAQANNRSMMLMMPLMSVYIGFIMPAALGVYWIAQSVMYMIQEIILGKFYNGKLQAEEDAAFEAKMADRKRRQEEARIQQEQRKQEEAKKMSLREKQQAAQDAKAAKAAKAAKSTTEAGRVGERPYARGRSYKADRYDD